MAVNVNIQRPGPFYLMALSFAVSSYQWQMVNDTLKEIHVLLGPLVHFIFYKSLLLHSIGKNESHSPSICKRCGGCEMWRGAGQGKHEHLVTKDQISIWIFFSSIISHLFS